MTEPDRLHSALEEAVGPSLAGHREVVEMLTVALLARGHVLLGGWPVGESARIASTFSRALGLSRERKRLTPDVELTDLLGSGGSIVDGGDARGSAFSQHVLQADGFNRAPPAVQSTMVSAMEEGRFSVRGSAVDLPRPFMIVATLSPIEGDDVYGLSASVSDQFLFQLRIDDLDADAARKLLDRYDQGDPLDDVEPVAGPEDVLAAQSAVGSTYVDDSIKDYLLDIVLATREHPDVEHGVAVRSAVPILRAVKAYATIRGRDFVIPDDVNAVAVPALAPRLVLTTDAELDGIWPTVVAKEVLGAVTPPGTEFEEDAPPVEERD